MAEAVDTSAALSEHALTEQLVGTIDGLMPAALIEAAPWLSDPVVLLGGAAALAVALGVAFCCCCARNPRRYAQLLDGRSGARGKSGKISNANAKGSTVGSPNGMQLAGASVAGSVDPAAARRIEVAKAEAAALAQAASLALSPELEKALQSAAAKGLADATTLEARQAAAARTRAYNAKMRALRAEELSFDEGIPTHTTIKDQLPEVFGGPGVVPGAYNTHGLHNVYPFAAEVLSVPASETPAAKESTGALVESRPRWGWWGSKRSVTPRTSPSKPGSNMKKKSEPGTPA